MAVTTSGQILQVLDPAKQEVFLDGAIRLSDIDAYTWIRVRPADTRTIEKASINPPGTYSPKAEGSDYSWSEMTQGNSKTYTMSESQMAFQVSSFSNHFLNSTLQSEFFSSIGASGTRKLNSDAYSVISGGFTDTGPDGVSLFNDSHPMADGSTSDNRATAALAESSLQAALVVLRRQLTPDGVLSSASPDYLIVPPDLEFAAKELVGSDLSGADMQLNVVKSKNLTVLVAPDLTDTSDWFLLDSQSFRAYQFVAKGPNPQSYIDPASDNYRVKDSIISCQGYDGWRGSFGAVVA